MLPFNRHNQWLFIVQGGSKLLRSCVVLHMKSNALTSQSSQEAATSRQDQCHIQDHLITHLKRKSMVEGPEYRRHAEILQILVGQRLCRVLRAHPALAATLSSEFIGLRVLRVFSVGKELFAVFESRKQIEVEDEAAERFSDGKTSLSVTIDNIRTISQLSK